MSYAVGNPSSIEKIREFIRLSNSPQVVLSPMFFREYICPEKCGGCCKGNVTLDYIGDRWEVFKDLYPEHIDKFIPQNVDGVQVYSTQLRPNTSSIYCQFLDDKTGRCNIHECVPFSCEFVLSKFIDNQSRNRSLLTTTYYGRAFNFKCVDGTKGAKCQIKGFNYKKFRRDIELLRELNTYAEFWKMPTKLPQIIEFLETLEEPIKEPKIF